MYRDVLGSFIHAFLQAAHTVANRQADIPEQADERLQQGVVGGGMVIGQQDQQVDIGIRKQLATSIAAHGDQRDFLRQGERLPQVA